jgi:hypothetical protein
MLGLEHQGDCDVTDLSVTGQSAGSASARPPRPADYSPMPPARYVGAMALSAGAQSGDADPQPAATDKGRSYALRQSSAIEFNELLDLLVQFDGSLLARIRFIVGAFIPAW